MTLFRIVRVCQAASLSRQVLPPTTTQSDFAKLKPLSCIHRKFVLAANTQHTMYVASSCFLHFPWWLVQVLLHPLDTLKYCNVYCIQDNPTASRLATLVASTWVKRKNLSWTSQILAARRLPQKFGQTTAFRGEHLERQKVLLPDVCPELMKKLCLIMISKGGADESRNRWIQKQMKL
jgi:hypothetical protein